MPIRVHFTPEDLGRVRLALHPLGEVVEAVDVLNGPTWRQTPFAAWSTEARAALERLELAPLRALMGNGLHVPDFLAPPPQRPSPTFSDQLNAVRTTDRKLVRREVEGLLCMNEGHPEDGVTPFLHAPDAALDRLVETLSACWEGVLAPYWQRIRATLEADLAQRALRLASDGPGELLSDLHPGLTFRAGVLEIASRRTDADVALSGRGLVLVPSVFRWHTPGWTFAEPWRPMIVYPARGAFRLWQERHAAEDAVKILLGHGRAVLLRGLTVPTTTGELAHRLGVTPSAVSQQVSDLRRAGLVADRRAGRLVHHTLSARGEALLRLLED